MGVLTEIPDKKLITDKGKIIVNPAFDTVLEIQRLYKEEDLTDFEKVEQALKNADKKQLEFTPVFSWRKSKTHGRDK